MFDGFYVGSLLLGMFLFLVLLFLFIYRKRIDIKRKALLIVWNGVLGLFMLMLVFIAGETYYRFFVDTTDSFGINKVSQRWMKNHYRFNNVNLRDNIDYEPKIEQGKRRITIFGDSFTAGHGVKSVNDRYANILRNTYPNLEVHVIAVNGANTHSQLEYINTLEGLGYEFDLVLLAYCLNDIDYFLYEAHESNKRIHAFNKKLNYLQRESFFINMLSFRWFALNDPDFMNYSKYVLNAYLDKDTWEKQAALLKEMKTRIHEHGGFFTAATFPFLQQTIEDYEFKQVHAQLGNFWKKQGVSHLDLLNTFAPHLGDDLTVNYFDAHPNEKAHLMAFKAVDQFFKDSPKP